MTRERATENQKHIAKHYNLVNWYGIECGKCCGVFPKIITQIGPKDLCRYECEVCGRTTKAVDMPWEAREEWLAGRFVYNQIRLF